MFVFIIIYVLKGYRYVSYFYGLLPDHYHPLRRGLETERDISMILYVRMELLSYSKVV